MQTEVLQSLQIQPKVIIPTPDEFLASYRRQSFSIPDSIIYYVAKNPSCSKMYQKMVQCCKYFFIKNPIIVIPKVGPQELPQLDDLNDSTKIWIVQKLIVPPSSQNVYQWLFTSILPKLYKLHFLEELRLSNVSLTFEELVLLTSSAKVVGLENALIKYSKTGNEVEFEKVVEICSNVVYFEYKFGPNTSNFSSKTIANLIKLPNFLNMKGFGIYITPDTFDVTPLFEFLKKTDIFVAFHFCKSLSENYRNLLQNIVNDILNSDSYIYGPPPLLIPGLTPDIQEALRQKARKVKETDIF